MSFRDQHKEMMLMIGEIIRLRTYNKLIGSNKNLNEAQKDLEYLLFAEGAILFMSFERFLRIVPLMKQKIQPMSSSNDIKLRQLLDIAFKKENKIFDYSKIRHNNKLSCEKFKENICRIRNNLLHGNYEKLAQQDIENGYACNMREYFKKGLYTQDLEFVYTTLNDIISQVNSNTGEIT